MNNLFIEPYLPTALSSQENLLYFQELEQNPKLRDIIITGNLRLVAHRIFHRFFNLNIDKEDLFSIGVIGLIKAVDSFNLNKKATFIAYASTCIDNEILMYLRKINSSTNEKSLESFMVNDELPLINIVEDQNAHMIETYEEKETFILLKQAIQKLPEREKIVIIQYFGLQCQPMTEREIAKQLNISRSYISRIIKQSLIDLKKLLEQERISDYTKIKR